MVQKVQKNNTITNLLKEYFSNYQETNDPFEHIAIYTTNQIIGLVVYSIIYERSEINYILVLKDYRHNHIGTKLLDFAIADIEKHNCKNITLEVNKNNYPAINLYSQKQFKIKAIRPNYYHGEDAYLMVRELR